MALKRYRVQVQSGRSMVDTILKLTPEEAQRIGATEYVKEPLTPKQGVKSRTATVKPRTPRNKAATPEANKTAEPSESKPFEDATDPGASE